MRYLNSFKKFRESILIDLGIQNIGELVESLNIWSDDLLMSIGAEEVDIFSTFHLPTDKFANNLDLDFLEDNIEFINSLSSIALKKSELQYSEDYSTFLNKPCKFMFIYGTDKNELENPDYLLFQSWQDSLNKWDDVKLYKVNENAKKFYDKLSSKTIELVDGDMKFLYSTANENEWVLQNSEKENDIYKKIFRKEELEKFLSDKNIKVNII